MIGEATEMSAGDGAAAAGDAGRLVHDCRRAGCTGVRCPAKPHLEWEGSRWKAEGRRLLRLPLALLKPCSQQLSSALHNRSNDRRKRRVEQVWLFLVFFELHQV